VLNTTGIGTACSLSSGYSFSDFYPHPVGAQAQRAPRQRPRVKVDAPAISGYPAPAQRLKFLSAAQCLVTMTSTRALGSRLFSSNSIRKERRGPAARRSECRMAVQPPRTTTKRAVWGHHHLSPAAARSHHQQHIGSQDITRRYPASSTPARTRSGYDQPGQKAESSRRLGATQARDARHGQAALPARALTRSTSMSSTRPRMLNPVTAR